MFFNVLIILLVSTLVFDDGKYVICTDKNKITDTLNTLLECSGWKEIGDFKFRFPHNFPGNYFSVVSDLLYINIAESNKIVSDNNYIRKYAMTMFSVACVYANELVKFINLTKIILHISNMERNRVRIKKYQKQPPAASATRVEINEQADEDDLMENINFIDRPSASSSSIQNSADYTYCWKMFNSAVKQFQKSWLMFEYMFEALRFLEELVPQKYFQEYLPELIRFRHEVTFFKVRSTDITLVLYGFNADDYNSCNEDKLREYLRKFSQFISNAESFNRFIDNYCIIPEIDKAQIVQDEDVYKTFFPQGRRYTIEDKFHVVHYLEGKIESLVSKFTKKYFKDFGFLYDFTS